MLLSTAWALDRDDDDRVEKAIFHVHAGRQVEEHQSKRQIDTSDQSWALLGDGISNFPE
jgi:hypothetical protein